LSAGQVKLSGIKTSISLTYIKAYMLQYPNPNKSEKIIIAKKLSSNDFFRWIIKLFLTPQFSFVPQHSKNRAKENLTEARGKFLRL